MLYNLPIYKFNTVTSTMDIAKQCDHECIILAKNQTHGRGKPGSSWVSVTGNLMMTIRTYSLNMLDVQHLSILFGVIVGESLSYFDLNIKYKFPNDVYLDNKKIAGILIEKYETYSIIGIGVNFQPTMQFACAFGITAMEYFRVMQKYAYKYEQKIIQNRYKDIYNIWESKLY